VDFENLKRLAKFGFVGGVRVSELQRSGRPRQTCLVVPPEPGVYLIVRKSVRPVRFSRASCGGWFKQRNPALPVASLKTRWVTRAKILYIGKAGGPGQRATLRSRLRSYMRFGLGEACAHWGGRCIWQLPDAEGLWVYWKVTTRQTPRQAEKGLLKAFVQCYGQRPFANLRG
jgi:hypothetical protein